MRDAGGTAATLAVPAPPPRHDGEADGNVRPRHAPPRFDEAHGTHVVTRHADALVLLRSPHVAVDDMADYRRALAGGAEPIPSLERLLASFSLYLNGPRHEAARRWQVEAWRLIERDLSPAMIAETVAGLVRALPRGVTVDALGTLCDRIAPALLARVLGLDAEWVAAVGDGVARIFEAGQKGHTRASLLALEGEARVLDERALDALLSERVMLDPAARRRAPPGETDALGVFLFLLGASVHTTAGLLGNALALALLDDDVWRAFDGRTAPSRRALRELARLAGSVRYSKSRLLTASVDGPGWTMPRRTRFIIDFEQVARDPSACPDPHRFRPDEDRPPPLGFGAGPHACIGAATALLILETALRTILAEARPVLAAPSVRFTAGTPFRRPLALPVRFEAPR